MAPSVLERGVGLRTRPCAFRYRHTVVWDGSVSGAILGRDAQVVVMQLHGPAGVLTVLLDQRFDDGWAQTDEVAAIVAQSVLELIDRIWT